MIIYLQFILSIDCKQGVCYEVGGSGWAPGSVHEGDNSPEVPHVYYRKCSQKVRSIYVRYDKYDFPIHYFVYCLAMFSIWLHSSKNKQRDIRERAHICLPKEVNVANKWIVQ